MSPQIVQSKLKKKNIRNKKNKKILKIILRFFLTVLNLIPHITKAKINFFEYRVAI